MVVQRDLPVHVWGSASEGEQITVTFRSESRSTTTDRIGRWSLYLAPGAAVTYSDIPLPYSLGSESAVLLSRDGKA